VVELFTLEYGLALLTLTALEIVLGIDNIVVIAILTNKLPHNKQSFARRLGLGGAMLMRVGLLLAISWIMRLTEPLSTLWGHPFSGRDLILLAGGAFLIAKGTHEIHSMMEGGEQAGFRGKAAVGMTGVIVQIMLLDIVFSLDSVITAVGMAESITVMVLAIIAAVGMMMFCADAISGFIEHHPTIKMLALSFLLLIGVVLVADGLGKEIEKAYLYFAMGFSLTVELLNLRLGKTPHPPSPRAAPEEATTGESSERGG
jgi:predicted tellurium resistance membrane protein TerC